MHNIKLSELIDMAVEAEREYGDVDVVLVGNDNGGQFVQSHVDIAVCQVTRPNMNRRTVFAILTEPAVEVPATLMQ